MPMGHQKRRKDVFYQREKKGPRQPIHRFTLEEDGALVGKGKGLSVVNREKEPSHSGERWPGTTITYTVAGKFSKWRVAAVEPPRERLWKKEKTEGQDDPRGREYQLWSGSYF